MRTRRSFVVDALDECDDGLDDLVSLISTSLSLSCKVRWLVFSRPELDLFTKIEAASGKCMTATEIGHELEVQNQDYRVNKYVRHKISELKRSEYASTYYQAKLLETLEREIDYRARNNLRWVSDQFQNLKSLCGECAVRSVRDLSPSTDSCQCRPLQC